MIKEKTKNAPSGLLALPVLLGIAAASIWQMVVQSRAYYPNDSITIVAIVALILSVICLLGFFRVQPNEGMVLQFFGKYVGTVRAPGLRWANPLYSKRSVSLRVRNFETSKLKVNDQHGNPIEIAAVVVWKVVDTAEAVFEVDDFVNYVHVQSEAAVRNMATRYPYDAHNDEETSLVTDQSEVAQQLRIENQQRLEKAGIEIIESRISHLAYAQEIAQAMLRRQQASAVIAARRKIVEGAVGMVEHALEQLSEKSVVELDEERKATMVSNLLVVLCSESEARPVVNTGSLY
jgi:regulator of protease activity HflC (stomatin/prohibitin superfamily)